MKKLLLLLSLLLITYSVQSQNKRRALESNRVYMEVGPSLMWLYGNEILGFARSRVGFHVGLGYTQPLAGSIYTHTGLYATRKGNQYVGTFTDLTGRILTNATTNYSLDYVTIPYLLRFEGGDRTRVYVEAGPFASFLFRAEESVINDGSTISARDVTNEFQRYDAGVAFGAGFGFSLLNNFFGTFGARYAAGLLNISKLPVVNDQTIKTSALDLRFGFGVWLGR